MCFSLQYEYVQESLSHAGPLSIYVELYMCKVHVMIVYTLPKMTLALNFAVTCPCTIFIGGKKVQSKADRHDRFLGI